MLAMSACLFLAWVRTRSGLRKQRAQNNILIEELKALDLERRNLARRNAVLSQEKLSVARDHVRSLAQLGTEFGGTLKTIASSFEQLDHAKADTTQRDLAKYGRAAAQNMMRGLARTLDSARIELGLIDVKRDRHSARELASDWEALLAERVMQSGKRLSYAVHVTDNTPREIFLDARLVGQIVSNLVDNAIRYTDRGGIEILLKPSNRMPDGLDIRLIDSGSGISDATTTSLFEKAGVTESADPEIERGLGLSVSHDLAGLLDADLRLERSGPSGVELVLELPDAFTVKLPSSQDPTKSDVFTAA